MAEDGMKISFGFTKTTKKTNLKHVPQQEKKKIEYIECIDKNSIKIIGGDEKKNEPLTIPMLGSKTWHDRIINKVDADIFEQKNDQTKNEPTINVKIKQEPVDATANGDASTSHVEPMEVVKIKNEPDNEAKLSLEEQAAREIMADLGSDKKEKNNKIFTVPIKQEDKENLRGKEESTLEDYETIPIECFGEAMLRGMGWQPGSGIGKDRRIVELKMPELRPKGMGLGADKAMIQKTLQRCSNKDDKEQLKLSKGAHVKIVVGKLSGYYGIVEAFDEVDARIFVKLALGNDSISVNEYCVEPVTSAEYMDKSKILNVKSYEEYKDEEKQNKLFSRSPKSSDDDDHRNRRSKKSKKKSLKNRNQSSDDERSSTRKPSRNRSSSRSRSSDDDYKKSKKHKNRDKSSERLSRKNKKKDRDKEREKSRQKKYDYSDSSERERNRDRRRSRSHTPKNRRRY